MLDQMYLAKLVYVRDIFFKRCTNVVGQELKIALFLYIFFRLCLVFKKFDAKYKEKKTYRKIRTKLKVKKNKNKI